MGDGAIPEFGSVADAVSCAVAMQDGCLCVNGWCRPVASTVRATSKSGTMESIHEDVRSRLKLCDPRVSGDPVVSTGAAGRDDLAVEAVCGGSTAAKRSAIAFACLVIRIARARHSIADSSVACRATDSASSPPQSVFHILHFRLGAARARHRRLPRRRLLFIRPRSARVHSRSACGESERPSVRLTPAKYWSAASHLKGHLMN